MTMKKNKAALVIGPVFLLILTLSGLEVYSQEGRGSGRLMGTVVDEAGKPVEGALITLEYVRFTNKLTAVSNSKGQWGFIGLGKGAVSITTAKEGFVPSTIPLEVSGVNRNPEPKIILKRATGNVAAEGLSDSSKELLLQGNALFEQKKFAEAMALYQAFSDKYPSLYKVRLNVANCLMELQEYDKAIAEYQKVLDGLNAEAADKKDPKLTAQVFSGIGDAYMRQNKFKEAEQYFKKSIDIDPADHAPAYNVAEIMMQAGNADEAIRYYEMAIRIKPDWPKSYLKLGYAWLNKGNNQKAIESFTKFIETSPADDPDVALAKDIIKKISKIP
jgi:tetratricopeptide (TPR) repeat protein